MKIDIISDTESCHHLLSLDGGDMLIHAGDMSYRGSPGEITEFLTWFGKQDYKYKIITPGNRDRSIDYRCDDAAFIDGRTLANWREEVIAKWLNEDYNRHILLHAMQKIGDITIFGSPWTPSHTKNLEAFTEERGESIKRVWKSIPENVDILITHGPPKGILDYVPGVGHVGCADLTEKVMEVKPKVHIFGHVHEEYGHMFKNETLFINATTFEGMGKFPRNVIKINFENNQIEI